MGTSVDGQIVYPEAVNSRSELYSVNHSKWLRLLWYLVAFSGQHLSVLEHNLPKMNITSLQKRKNQKLQGKK